MLRRRLDVYGCVSLGWLPGLKPGLIENGLRGSEEPLFHKIRDTIEA